MMDTISQDWNLLYAAEKIGYTIFKFSRLLKLCNAQDKTVDQGTPHLIYAWSDHDPAPGQDISFLNATKRGTKSLNLISNGKKDGYQVTGGQEELHFTIENVTGFFLF